MKNSKDRGGCVNKTIIIVKKICAERGIRLTPSRMRVMDMILRSRQPVKAYAILKSFSDSSAPPTVYRALNFLIENGFVHKIASSSSYVACIHPESRHPECFFLLCSVCGNTKEFCGGLSKTIVEAIGHEGFGKEKIVLEVHGVCAGCGGV